MNDSSLRSCAAQAAVGGAVLLFVDWWADLTVVGSQGSRVYVGALVTFNWTLRVGGVALLAAAGMCLAGLRAGQLVDAVVSMAAGVIFVGCAVVWMVSNFELDMIDLLALVGGGSFISSGVRQFVQWRDPSRATRTKRRPPAVPAAPSAPQPPHPASIRPKSISGDAPPPDGYLAALAKEDDEPPPASF